MMAAWKFLSDNSSICVIWCCVLLNSLLIQLEMFLILYMTRVLIEIGTFGVLYYNILHLVYIWHFSRASLTPLHWVMKDATSLLPDGSGSPNSSLGFHWYQCTAVGGCPVDLSLQHSGHSLGPNIISWSAFSPLSYVLYITSRLLINGSWCEEKYIYYITKNKQT